MSYGFRNISNFGFAPTPALPQLPLPPTLNVLILTEEADDNPAERKQVMDDQKPIIVISDACCGMSQTVTFQFTVPSQTGQWAQ